MTASGPFAMGPALAGISGRRTAPRPAAPPIAPQPLDGGAPLGAGLTQTKAPTLAQGLGARAKGKKDEESDEGERYSDADEGVEIVDMDRVKMMDWNAPDSLPKEKDRRKTKKREPSIVKKEEPTTPEKRKGKGTETVSTLR